MHGILGVLHYTNRSNLVKEMICLVYFSTKNQENGLERLFFCLFVCLFVCEVQSQQSSFVVDESHFSNELLLETIYLIPEWTFCGL